MRLHTILLTLLAAIGGTAEASAQTTADSIWSEEDIAAATLVCRKIDDNTYAFVNNEGKYFIWRGSGSGTSQTGYNSNSGVTDSYDKSSTKMTDMTITKMTTGTTNVNGTQDELFGCMTIAGKRSAGTEAYFVMGEEVFYGASSPYFNDDYSSAILMEEVSYPNTVTPTAVSNVTNLEGYIATFSAPFPTVVPEGATAYYVSGTETNGATLTARTQAISEAAIPANTGVILTATSDAQLTMVPATTETTSNVLATNLLGHSAGASKTIASTDNAYLLSTTGGTTAFYKGTAGTELDMNRAYLVSNSSASYIALGFNATQTGIETVTDDNAEANSPLYDLSGRRVNHAQKGGVYIRGGKKVIVK